MNKKTKSIKEKIREQNEFLQHLVNSFEDIKAGRIKDFKFSED